MGATKWTRRYGAKTRFRGEQVQRTDDQQHQKEHLRTQDSSKLAANYTLPGEQEEDAELDIPEELPPEPITEAEVQRAVFAANTYKAPGPDDIPAIVWQKSMAIAQTPHSETIPTIGTESISPTGMESGQQCFYQYSVLISDIEY